MLSCFECSFIQCNSIYDHKHELNSPQLLLDGDKFMPEIHLKQPGFIYSACGSFTKNKQRTQEFEEIGDTKYIYTYELDIAYFQHDMVYRTFKKLATRTVFDKFLRDKAFNIAFIR